jgi:hypothetical protein
MLDVYYNKTRGSSALLATLQKRLTLGFRPGAGPKRGFIPPVLPLGERAYGNDPPEANSYHFSIAEPSNDSGSRSAALSMR